MASSSGLRHALLLPPALLLAASCSPLRHVPAEHVRTDSVTVVRRDTVLLEAQSERADSLVRRDSVFVKEFVRQVVDSAGRVLRTDRELEKTATRTTERHASLLADYRELEREYEALLLSAADRAAEPMPVEVERDLSRWQRLKLDLGGWAMLALLAAAALWLRRRGIL